MRTPDAVLRHGRIDLALYRLSAAPGVPLLVLHGLGEQAPAEVPADAAGWEGPVWALDFSGHGGSSVPVGGGYSAELLMADADAAVRHILGGPTPAPPVGSSPVPAGGSSPMPPSNEPGIVLLGRGLGGYVALLLAGARADVVRGAVVADGPGLVGGPPRPGSNHIDTPRRPPAGAAPVPDPYALLELATDIRPTDYSVRFAHAAAERSPLDHPVVVAAASRPPWLAAVVEDAAVLVTTSVTAALRSIARQLSR